MARTPLIPISQVRINNASPAPISYGFIPKPTGCGACSYRRIGQGFCPDWQDSDIQPRIAVLLESPGIDEIHQGQPLVGRAGRFWLHSLIESNGYKREDCLICSTIRCHAPGDKYPTGKLRVDAEHHCRAYDDRLTAFNPDLFVITAHPAMLLRSSAMYRLVRGDVRKAFEYAGLGFRPCVSMGDKAMGTFAPWAEGGVKRWRGHTWEGSIR